MVAQPERRRRCLERTRSRNTRRMSSLISGATRGWASMMAAKGARNMRWKWKAPSSRLVRNLRDSCLRESIANMASAVLEWHPTRVKNCDRVDHTADHVTRDLTSRLKSAHSTTFCSEKTRGELGPTPTRPAAAVAGPDPPPSPDAMPDPVAARRSSAMDTAQSPLTKSTMASEESCADMAYTRSILPSAMELCTMAALRRSAVASSAAWLAVMRGCGWP
mmetsp:Transcript_1119/g.4323  ORF Transcript_1119/g.4323 Transcript_1119/m.4323 type:complete len:220 (-) Transcript_1119:548-1207(-)